MTRGKLMTNKTIKQPFCCLLYSDLLSDLSFKYFLHLNWNLIVVLLCGLFNMTISNYFFIMLSPAHPRSRPVIYWYPIFTVAARPVTSSREKDKSGLWPALESWQFKPLSGCLAATTLFVLNLTNKWIHTTGPCMVIVSSLFVKSPSFAWALAGLIIMHEPLRWCVLLSPGFCVIICHKTCYLKSITRYSSKEPPLPGKWLTNNLQKLFNL